MAERELGFQVDFGHGAVKCRQVEERVVTKAAGAARSIQNAALARALGMVSYKSVPLLEERFARKPNRYGDENPYLSTSAGQNGRFDVAGYLDYQGQSFISRFDPNSYVSITRTMDIFDPVRAHETPYAAYARIAAHLTLVGISTDWLFPPEDVRSLAAIIRAAGARCDYREMASNHGHDAFLAEPDTLVRLLSPVFD